MTAKVKSLLTVVSEAVETAAGYAFLAVGIYSAIFVDITGNGSLYDTVRHMNMTAAERAAEATNATRVIKVPTQVVAGKAHEDRILAVFDQPASEPVVAAYQVPETTRADITDSPADPEKAGKEWKVGLKGELRNFTVYGKGDQTSSASAPAAAPARAAAPEPVTVAAVSGSAATAASESSARPGMGTRMSRGGLAASETSRNVR